MKRVLTTTHRLDYYRCLTEKMLTYALGRGLERYDRPTVQEIARRSAAKNYKFSSLVQDIVTSKPFQLRQGKGTP